LNLGFYYPADHYFETLGSLADYHHLDPADFLALFSVSIKSL